MGTSEVVKCAFQSLKPAVFQTRRVKAAFPGRKLYCALNISFHHRDLARLREHIALFGQYPLDAFIIQDLGLLDLLGERFSHTPLHLSTQANCINREAAKLYRRLGFSRIVLGREASLAEIREIKDVHIRIGTGSLCIRRCLGSVDWIRGKR
ncbi:peptidase U32 family protein [Treponema endosymbiont of Eucomonympha sp.]|uniref:peptidase U32 family protein n=1 Tax=Treponema endosymbiont of Eucomonympha sp. TaxID=1580831 RepID=UPI0007848B4E|nr:U32 family peptidase [Treponema endosymbiont of Eucomonympha sp.]